MATRHANVLIESLRSRELPVPGNEIKKALEMDGGAAIKSWVEEYLGQDTLLTKEELALYESLQKSGEFENLKQSSKSLAIRAVYDDDIRDAIEDLRKQTATIEKQTAILKVQQTAVAGMVKKSQQGRRSREDSEGFQIRAWAAENSLLDAKIDESMTVVKLQIDELKSHVDIAGLELQKKAVEVLAQDDKLLVGLQKLAVELDPESPQEEEASRRIRDLCARLIKHTVEGIRTRLDRVYFESTIGFDTTRNESNDQNQDVLALKQELESLYSEILPVAQMSTEQQFLGPAIHARAMRGGKGRAKMDAAIKYMNECITAVTSRLHDLSLYAEEYQSQRLADSHLVDIANAEMQQHVLATKDGAFPSTSQNTQTTSNSVPAPREIRRLSIGSNEEEVAAEQQILRNIGLAPPDPRKVNNDDDMASYFQRATRDRQAKAAGHGQNLQEAEEKAIASSLQDAHATLHSLRNSLLSETRYGSVMLVDAEIEEAITLMRREVDDMKAEVQGVDVEKLRERNVLRDSLVERWAR